MRIFITGVSGLLGINAALQLKERHEVSGAYLTHPVKVPYVSAYPVDLSKAVAVEEIFRAKRPEVVLHTAGLTNVDACEASPAEAKRLHVEVTRHVARAAKQVGARLVHISTDHLSDGTKDFVTEESTPAPLNEYARTKWQAEQVAEKECPGALIIRTNFFGWGTPVKKSFSDWILDGLRSGRRLTLFHDVYISPILINDLVDVIEELIQCKESGIFNVASRDRISKFEFGMRLEKLFGRSPGAVLEPVSVGMIEGLAHRPLDMSLNTQKVARLLGKPMPTVEAGLKRLKELELQGWPELAYKSLLLLG
ncbi:MAG: SDR family oxidoreductase [Nitrospiraceae bacterium]|nr:MAG: SDR family oxidoreductase [Nitrospiraceae bacterium]